MNVQLLSLLLVIGVSLSNGSRPQWGKQLRDLEPLVKRGYVLHNINNGYPRYTSLVRRNFIRFGKRSGVGSQPPHEQHDHDEPSMNNYVQPSMDKYVQPSMDKYVQPSMDKYVLPPMDKYVQPPMDKYVLPPMDKYVLPPMDKYVLPPMMDNYVLPDKHVMDEMYGGQVADQEPFHQDKRVKSFIRFGKRAPRSSNFIRFGRSMGHINSEKSMDESFNGQFPQDSENTEALPYTR